MLQSGCFCGEPLGGRSVKLLALEWHRWPCEQPGAAHCEGRSTQQMAAFERRLAARLQGGCSTNLAAGLDDDSYLHDSKRAVPLDRCLDE